MNLNLKSISLGVAAMTVFTTACTRHVTEREYVTVPAPAQQQQQPTVVERVTVVQPPAAPHEEMPAAPATTGYSWVPGHYVRDDGRWKWVAGQWVAGTIAPMPQALAEATPSQPGPTDRWIPGYWTVDHSNWVWVKGHWDD